MVFPMKIKICLILFFLYSLHRSGVNCECPKFYKINQDKEVLCLEICPKLYTNKGECVDTCSKDFPKLYNGITCVDNCSIHDLYTIEEGLDCLDGCPSNKTFYIKEERICYESCPESKKDKCIVFTFEEDQSKLYIILAILIPFCVLLILIVLYYLYKKNPRLLTL